MEEAIGTIDAQLQKAHDAVGKTSLTAAASGTVKRIYANVGDDASDVMAEYGSLLLIPVAALYEQGNPVVVYRGYDPETNALIDPVPVTTGFSDGTNAEILSGLSAGDIYYYNYADSVVYTTGTTE